MDAILIAGRDVAHHDAVLRQVLDRAQSYNLKLNFDKVKIRKEEVPYVGHLISAHGLKPDPTKVEAMKNMPAPEKKDDVRRFLGSVQYLAKFLPDLAEVEEPLRHLTLTKKDTVFHWDKPQENAFQRIKDLCCTAPILAYYDVKKDVKIQCDASKNAVGAVLLQEGKPIAYTSQKLRTSELNWSPIEKELLVIVFSTEKFREYILGKETVTMMLKVKVKGYDLKVEYLPGKKQVIADTLTQQKEPMMPSKTPDYPWAEAASDIFTFKSKNYEVTELNDLSAFSTIEALKGHFERHANGEAEAALCVGRRLRTNLPISRSLLEPEAYNTNDIKRRMRHVKEKQTYYHNRHGTKELSPLKPGEHVRIRPEPGSKLWRQATVVDHHSSPRSYIVDTGQQKLRRNRVALKLDPGRSTVEVTENDYVTNDDMSHHETLDNPNPASVPPAHHPSRSG
ncbi:Hypothetical predicted protein, partial [Paramuricea clavata]